MLNTWGFVSARMALAAGPDMGYQMLAIGGGLLLIAAVLPIEELRIYLLRIASALERTERSESQQDAIERLRMLQRLARAQANGKVREMPKHR
jgi:hypothetical protein